MVEGIERWPCNPRVNGSIPVPMAEQTSGDNECCSVASPHSSQPFNIEKLHNFEGPRS